MMALKADEYIVQKVVDIKWVSKIPLYRVRWEGYGPGKDTWEPYESFNSSSIKFVNDFERQFEEMSSGSSGLNAAASVNILSREIDEIVYKRHVRIGPDQKEKTLYRVKWKDTNGGNTWEESDNLCHAQDKIDMYNHRKRVSNNKKISFSKSSTYNEDSQRRIEHRKFWNSTDKGQIVLQSADLYSRVKNRRNMSQKMENVNTAHKEKEICKNYVDENFYHGNIFENLPKYDATQTLNHLITQAETTFPLSEEEFNNAALNGDYNKVFANMRHLDSEPKVDFVNLFLETSRKGFRDVAMLLATKVPDLTVENAYGNSALTMAANQSDALFAHQLLVMGAPLHQPTSHGHTASSVALQFHNVHFLRFLANYEAGTLPF